MLKPINSISKIIINSAIIITPLLATSQLQAADENVYDASSCVTISGTATLSTNNALINNSSTTSLRVRCPIQRDRNHVLLDSEDSFVLVRDHTNSGRVSCSLRQNLVSRTGTITLESTTASTGTPFSSTVYQELKFSKRPFTNTDEASAYLFCTLPPKQNGNLGSAISSYHIDED